MRVVFHAVNGTGLGHLTRALLLVREMARQHASFEGLVCTNAADLSIVGDAPVSVLRLPYTVIDEVRRGDDPVARRVNAEAFFSSLRAFEPDLVVFDTHVPTGLRSDRRADGCARALILRTLKKGAARKLLAGPLAACFDRIIVPQDFGAPPLPREVEEVPLRGRLVRVGPLIRPEPTEAAARRAAERYPLGPNERLILATLGGGGPQLAPEKRSLYDDAARFAKALVEAFSRAHQRDPSLRLVLQSGPHAPPPEGMPGVDIVRFDPDLPALYPRASLVVSLAGYNSVWEIVRAARPALLLTKRSRSESQHGRARALLESGALMDVVGEPDPDVLEGALENALNDEALGRRVSAALSRLRTESGVAAAAAKLAELATASPPRLPGPPPCEDPCKGCPIDTIPDAPSWEPVVERLVAAGERRVIVPCSAGRSLDLSAQLASLAEAGLTPLLETTGRMASDHPRVAAALQEGHPARLLLFGLDKKIHDKSCGRSGSFAATRDLARAVPSNAPAPQWRLLTTRFGERKDDVVLPIDRHAFLRVQKNTPAKVGAAVAVLRKRWLPYSEVFIYREACALTRYRPIIVCKETEGARWPALPVLPLGDLPPDRAARLLDPAGVVIAHAAFTSCAASFLGLIERLGVPLVVSARGHDVYRAERDHLPRVFAAADVVLARTDAMARDLEALGCPRNRIRVLPTGIDLSRFRYREPRRPTDRLRVVSVGRFTAKKGIPDCLDAFARLAESMSEATLDVYGLGHPDEGPDIVAEAIEACRQPPLAGRVRLHRAVPQAELARRLAAADLFVCAPRIAPDGDREGLPNALKEAMATGLPVVATSHGSVGELVGGEADPAGLLAAEGDAEGLGRALVALARDPDLWPQMSRSGRRRVEREFDLETIVAKLEAIYDELLTARGAPQAREGRGCAPSSSTTGS